MWIKHIILENFASVKVGMKTNQIEIDFSNHQNKVCLLVAPNGTGKTSLLSTFTPFASLGNLDVRDSTNLIISGMNGYKEITIIDQENEYLIKHFYAPNKDSHSVKSYIMKNGEELNINGNVRSFQAIVEEELGLQLNFLKLVRIGNNVNNLLQLSASERKKFLGKLLENLDVYLNYYKKLTEDTRVIKAQMSHVNDRIIKTNIESIEDGQYLLDLTNTDIKRYETERENLLQEYGSITKELEQLNYDELKEDHSRLTTSFKKASKGLNKINESNISLAMCEKMFKKEEERINELTMSISVSTSQLSLVRQNMDYLYEEKRKVELELEKENHDEALESINKIYEKLKDTIKEKESYFHNFHVEYTKEEIETLISTMINIQQILDVLYEFGKAPIQAVLELMERDESVVKFIDKGLAEVSYHSSDEYLLNKLLNEFGSNIEPSCDHTKCGLYQGWIRVKNLACEQVKINKDERTEEFYKYMDIINQRLQQIFGLLADVKDIIMKLPEKRQNDFLTKTMFDRMRKTDPIINREKYNILLTEITEYEHLSELRREFIEVKERRDEIKKTSKSSYLITRLKDIESQLDDNSYKIKSIKETIEMNQDEKDSLIETHETTEDMITALTKYNEIQTELSKNQDSIERYKELKKKQEDCNYDLVDNANRLDSCRKHQIKISTSFNEYKSLTKDLKKLVKLFDENYYIKSSMSSKNGIPLEFINIYMSGIRNTINDLLDIVYDGDLMIDEFKINSDEFLIPYIKDGYLIPDIVYASQGETAFLSIALSFALIAESILKYNIILLDEVDGNLDDKNRKKFILILERLIDMIGAEQIFLISHNNLFSMYPVDVLPLTGSIDSSLSLANVIEIKKD